MHSIVQQFNITVADFMNYSITKLLDNGADTNIISIMEDAQVLMQTMFIDLIKEILSRVDDSIYETVKASKEFTIKERNRSRTLTTTMGELEIHRRYYQCKETGNYHYLLDEVVGLKPYSRIDGACLIKLIESVKDVNYAKAAKIATPVPISKQTVMNKVHAFEHIPDTLTEPTDLKIVEELIIEVDEDHVAMQDSTNKQMRLATLYTHKEANGTNRVKLCNKHSFTTLHSADAFWQHIDTYCADHFEHTPKVTIIGDGAAWIKQGLDYLPNSRFVLDLFHLNKYIRQLCGNSLISPVYELIRANDKPGFYSYAQKQLINAPERAALIRKAMSYIRNQWDAARIILLDRTIHSSTEAHVSHILSARLSSRPMGWSPKGAENIAKLRVLHDNGESITEYVKSWLLNDEIGKVKDETVERILSAAASTTHIRTKLEPYNTYLPLQAASIPGTESKHNGWLKLYKDGGFQKLM